MKMSPSSRPPAVPQRFLIFGFVLSFSFLLLGATGGVLVWQMNSSFRNLIQCDLPTIALIRDISVSHSEVRRVLDAIPTRGTQPEIDADLRQLKEVRSLNGERIEQLLALQKSNMGEESVHELMDAREAYWKAMEAYLSGIRPVPAPLRKPAPRASLEERQAAYVKLQDNVSETCLRNAETMGDKLDRETRLVSRFFVAVALWPILLAGVFVVVIILMTLFRYHRAVHK